MYIVPAPDDPLTQGDLINDCPLVGLNPSSPPLDLEDPPIHWWTARVIVLTQACDLAQAKTGSVLVAPVHPARKLVEEGVLKAQLVRDQVRRHLVYGWYFIPDGPADRHLRESLIDLRDVHSVHRVVLDQLIASGKRVASLAPPHREHLAQHFAVTYMRVALPEPYGTQP